MCWVVPISLAVMAGLMLWQVGPLKKHLTEVLVARLWFVPVVRVIAAREQPIAAFRGPCTDTYARGRVVVASDRKWREN